MISRLKAIDPRLKYTLVLLPFWFVPVLLLRCQPLIDSLPGPLPDSLRLFYAILYFTPGGLLGWTPFSIGAVIATIFGLLFSFTDRLRNGKAYAILGFLSPVAAFAGGECGSWCLNSGMVGALLYASFLPSLVLAFIAWKFRP